MQTTDPLPLCPPLLAAAMRPLPLAPLGLALSVLSRRLAARHPGMFRRLGEHGDKRFALDLTDMPLALLLAPGGGRVRITAHRRAPAAEVRISGPLSAFLGMMHGAYDGDALFFSRDLTVEGDTEAALALRNAIDDAELDLAAELQTLAGPLRAPLAALIAAAERRTGVALHRVEGAWA